MKTLSDFVDEHRGLLDRTIRIEMDDPNFYIDEDDRWRWVVEHAGWRAWAESEGVQL